MLKIILVFLLVLSFNLQADNSKKYTQEQLDQMLAPIALYPDALLSQILMATTFNEQLQEAIDYSKKNPDEKGDEAVKKVQDKDWDASVASLVAFPDVLSMLGGKPKWAKDLGNAFLATPGDVMDRVQDLRKKAKIAGNLKTSKEQKVEVTDANATAPEVITIAPVTNTVYVPVYNPTYAYGVWMYPAYPPYYYYPPYYNPMPGFVFGFTVGIIASNCMWGGFGWHSHNVNINVNRYNNINVNKISAKKNNVNWKDHNQRAKNARTGNSKISKDRQRQNARKTMDSKGLNLSDQRKKLSGSKGTEMRRQLDSGKFNSGSRSNAFSGIDKPMRSNKAVDRGNFSRQNNSHSFGSNRSGGFSRGGSFGGGSMSRGSFGGGGHRGRR